MKKEKPLDFNIIKQAGIGQLEFGNLIPVSRVTVSNWVLGKTLPNRHVANKVRHQLALLRAAKQLKYLPGDIPSMHKDNVTSRAEYIHGKLASTAKKVRAQQATRAKK